MKMVIGSPLDRVLRHRFTQAGLLIALLLAALAATAAGGLEASREAPANGAAPAPDGREIFTREWVPGDPRSHGGDGLGPVFNDTSCVACHNQGGAGGAGSEKKNVQIITAFSAAPRAEVRSHSAVGTLFRAFFHHHRSAASTPAKEDPAADAAAARARAREERQRLARVHPAFQGQRSVVLHRSGSDPEYAAWRFKFLGLGQFAGGEPVFFVPPHRAFSPLRPVDALDSVERVTLTREQEKAMNVLLAESQLGGFPFLQQQNNIDGFAFLKSERNPPALFGSGAIDSIPEKAILEAAETKHAAFPEVGGRPARLKDGRIGRFGWKAQTASLEDFVSTACAVELGLEVPGRSQAGLPAKPSYRAPGLDLDRGELVALTSFVAGLPRPVERPSREAGERSLIETGHAHFEKAGCASCHLQRLAEVDGLYSDLLLHDLGPNLADSGSYGAFAPDVAEEAGPDEPLPSLLQEPAQAVSRKVDRSKLTGATRQEWRTPPLWGVRDSAPYLHDGRAATLEQAIAFHGGEAARSARKYFALPPGDQLALNAFLKSLVAPE